ncbi:TPA: recombinase family protein, partial [Streptococcus agalactiae]
MIQTNSNHLSFKAAIYCRLSKDDEQKGESASIQNQKELLENYVKSRGWSIYDVYIDDGYTGLNTNRPSFQRLIRDIENKKVDIVITKDLSRLGRNYLQTGYYTENFFPKNNVRYIALNDGVDTFQENNEIVPFKNVLNEFYSRDVSKKMKSAYMTRARQGKFIGCLAPIGYRKDNDDPHKLVIDDETSWIVEKIFDLAFSGYGVQAIRRRLFEEKIPTPTWWNRKKGLRNKKTKLEMTVDGGEYWWDCTTLKEIIENPV